MVVESRNENIFNIDQVIKHEKWDGTWSSFPGKHLILIFWIKSLGVFKIVVGKEELQSFHETRAQVICPASTFGLSNKEQRVRSQEVCIGSQNKLI